VSAADKRAQALRTIDEEIARKIAEAAASGELGLAEHYGKPFADDPGWDATPPALRMPMKILKDAGVAPPEIAMFRERARLRDAIAACADAAERAKLQALLCELEQHLALRLEALRIGGRL
jgi:hypothetical protein